MPGNDWRCRRQPSLPCGGVCPHCLRDRLLRLCPDCACPRPCPCASPSSSVSAFGRGHSLVDRERRVARSLSVAVPGGGNDQARPPRSRVWGWASFRKPPETAGCRDVEEEYEDAVALARSRSVSTAAASKATGWGRLIPGKIKALRRRKSTVR